MAIKPILFNTKMVRAILNGEKTQTRRAVKDKDIINNWDCESDGTPIAYVDQSTGDRYPPTAPCPYSPGDVLWVRETYCALPVTQAGHMRGHDVYCYRADGDLRPDGWNGNWKPSMICGKSEQK